MTRLAALFAVALLGAATMAAGGARAVGFHGFGFGYPGAGPSMTSPQTPSTQGFNYQFGHAPSVMVWPPPSYTGPSNNGAVMFFGLADPPASGPGSDPPGSRPPPNDIATSVTPLPAALPLFASALGGFGLFSWLRRRRESRRRGELGPKQL